MATALNLGNIGNLKGKVSEDAFDENSNGPQYPIIMWRGHHGDPMVEALNGGYFVITNDALSEGVVPGPYWEQHEIRFGTDPTQPKTPVWATQVLDCVLLAHRQRRTVQSPDGRLHHYSMYAKRETRVGFGAPNYKDYKTWTHHQAMLMIPGVDTPVVLTLKKYTRSLCWDNNPSSTYGHEQFPLGVSQSLRKYAKAASKQAGFDIPPYCAWKLWLRPMVNMDGSPYYVRVGTEHSQSFFSPFSLDMSTAPEGDTDSRLPSTRYVGDDYFRYENLRVTKGREWMDHPQWPRGAAAATVEEKPAANYDDMGDTMPVVEDEEIPF